MTEPRVDFPRLGQRVYQAMLSINTYLEGCSIPEALVELVNLRISQINGCAFCLDKHTAALIERGENSRRLATLAAWADSPLFDERERAALRWAETLTRLHGDGPTEHCYRALREYFDEQGVTVESGVQAGLRKAAYPAGMEVPATNQPKGIRHHVQRYSATQR